MGKLSMSDPPKRKINAKLILEAIQDGVDESEIQRRFELSDKAYRSVLRKLTEMGLLAQPAPVSGLAASRPEPKLTKHEIPVTWTCPACRTTQDRVYDECPHCGVVVAKIASMGPPRYSHERSFRYEDHDDSDGSKWWPAIIIGVFALLTVGVVIIKWSFHKPTKHLTSVSTAAVGEVRTFTKANFEREVKGASRSRPVLVMFHADW